MKQAQWPPRISKKSHSRKEAPIPPVYKAIDYDLARDNLENDLPFADRADISSDRPAR